MKLRAHYKDLERHGHTEKHKRRLSVVMLNIESGITASKGSVRLFVYLFNTVFLLIRTFVQHDTAVLAIFLYVSGSGTVMTSDRNRVDTVEMWCWREH